MPILARNRPIVASIPILCLRVAALGSTVLPLPTLLKETFMLARFSSLCWAVGGVLSVLASLQPASAATVQVVAPVAAVGKKTDTIALLLPDTADVTDARITVWTDAMAEEGL